MQTLIIYLINAGMDMGVYSAFAAYGVILLILLFLVYFLNTAFNGEVYILPEPKPKMVSDTKSKRLYLPVIDLIYKLVLVLILVHGLLLVFVLL